LKPDAFRERLSDLGVEDRPAGVEHNHTDKLVQKDAADDSTQCGGCVYVKRRDSGERQED
jgi:hypothetical protein